MTIDVEEMPDGIIRGILDVGKYKRFYFSRGGSRRVPHYIPEIALVLRFPRLGFLTPRLNAWAAAEIPKRDFPFAPQGARSEPRRGTICTFRAPSVLVWPRFCETTVCYIVFQKEDAELVSRRRLCGTASLLSFHRARFSRLAPRVSFSLFTD